ncbi:hypothetical protein ACPOL_3818 [Acidisarcina polymorpha]|uniref:MmcQ/YjbR family DNA-binding protein n=1 Tax=Acidisarcina polymorpha TaxID=2211140 RepID=A0A2Z5G353_9BACT|nr:MmcQ/YjbR family DNA-binding protein [Acidisarcina polymorpha]AXC13097.1 hypothetical protein ACPOL_3818 [Acidisarcina polymorpha]
MDAERIRDFLRKLPHVQETVQWGNNLVFWVGDKVVGGKMFTVVNLDEDGQAVISFSAGPERYHELLENEGVIPAPYLARIHWVALERWHALSANELLDLLKDARDLTYRKLPKRTKDLLALSPAALQEAVQERRKLLAARANEQAAAKAAAKYAQEAAGKTEAGRKAQAAKKAVKKASRRR